MAPFRSLLVDLLTDEARLRHESEACRQAFLAFALAREGGLRRELEAVSARRAIDAAATWSTAAECAMQRGYRIRQITQADVKQRRRGAGTDEPTADGDDEDDLFALADGQGEQLPRGVTYRVLHSPFVFLRAAPSTDAAVHSMLPCGLTLEVDTLRNGWVRTAEPFGCLRGGPSRRAWALIDGTSLGLGALLERVPEP